MPAEDESEVGETSSMMESTMLEGEECYDPETSEAWTEKGSAIGQLCRICATVNEYLIPIFSGEGLEHQLGMKIKKHLPIQVVEEDNLPLHVCYQCASTVIAWHDLVIGCVKAERKLRQIYKKKNKEEEEEEDDYGDSDKADYFDEPIDSETAEDPLKPSTSTRPIRTPRKKKTVTKAKVKKKIAPVKSLSGEPETPLALLQPKEEQVDADTATERFDEEVYLSAIEKSEIQSNISETNSHRGPTSFRMFKNSINTQRSALGPTGVEKVKRKTYKCETCGIMYVRKSFFLEHLKNHPVKVRPCEVCGGKNWSSEAQPSDCDCQCQNKNVVEHTPKQRYQCGVCQEWFASKVAIAKHMLVDHKYQKRNYKCGSCDKLFDSSRKRSHHIAAVHMKVKPKPSVRVACTVCGEVYSKTYIDLHMSNAHGIGRNRFVCEFCGQDFPSHYKYKCHSFEHTNRKDYVCDVCGASFLIMSHLTSHKNSHATTLASCSMCSATFKHKYSLKRHMLSVHLGSTPNTKTYSCDMCSKTFVSLVRMNEHLALHSEKVCYPCKCGRVYSSQRKLTDHQQRVHLEGYPCEQCGKTFHTKLGISQHMFRSHIKNTYEVMKEEQVS